MTEDQIERRVEREMDKLDGRLMNGLLSQDDYNRNAANLNRWAEQQYKHFFVRG
jgi:hypothetical protein